MNVAAKQIIAASAAAGDLVRVILFTLFRPGGWAAAIFSCPPPVPWR